MGVLGTIGRVSSDIGFIMSIIFGAIFVLLGVFTIVAKITPQPGMPAETPDQRRARKFVGAFMIVIGVFIPVISWIWKSVVHRSKTMANVAGGLTIVDTVSRLL